jgi:hypothetical protein
MDRMPAPPHDAGVALAQSNGVGQLYGARDRIAFGPIAWGTISA